MNTAMMHYEESMTSWSSIRGASSLLRIAHTPHSKEKASTVFASKSFIWNKACQLPAWRLFARRQNRVYWTSTQLPPHCASNDHKQLGLQRTCWERCVVAAAVFGPMPFSTTNHPQTHT
jgi:hypothetical protein